LLFLSHEFVVEEVLAMKTVVSLLTAAFLAGGLTTAALAADPSSTATGSTTTTMSGGLVTKEFKADQTTRGTISGMDPQKGSLTLKTDDGQNLMLNFPPEVLKNYKEGDHVVLSMALSKATDATQSMR
jgi:hypothetical protein